jgi:hypothetical protein
MHVSRDVLTFCKFRDEYAPLMCACLKYEYISGSTRDLTDRRYFYISTPEVMDSILVVSHNGHLPSKC